MVVIVMYVAIFMRCTVLQYILCLVKFLCACYTLVGFAVA